MHPSATRTGLGQIIGAAAILLCACGGFVWLVSSYRPPAPGVAPLPTATALSAPAWHEIDAQHTRLTGAQWDAYVAGLHGRIYQDLAGTVTDVKEPIPGLGYTLYLAVPVVAHPYAFTLDLPAADAPRYSKGQSLQVTGAIQDVSCVVWCSVHLTRVTLRSP